MTSTDLFWGDCFDIFPLIPDGSIDLIFADLPYGTTKNKWDEPLDLSKLWPEYERMIKDSGCIALWAQSPFDKILACSNLKLYRYEWVIKKTHPTGFLNAKKRPMKTHENLLIFYKRLPVYNPQMTTGHARKVSTAQHKRNCLFSTNYGDFDPVTYDSTERYPVDVLEFKWDTQKSKLHPTQKPISACEYFIKTYTNPGDIVLDNVMGSGSTGVAALSLGRRFIGIERDKAMFETARKRIGGTD